MSASARLRLQQFRESQTNKQLTEKTTATVTPATANDASTHLTQKETKVSAAIKEYKQQHATKHTQAMSSKPLAWWTKQALWIKVAIWSTLFVLAMVVGGLQSFFILCGFVLVYAYTREDTAVKGQKSAYSVFNKGGEKLAGTFDAEQFEDQMRGRAKGVF
eukprot:m.60552 g.60552  ORF g.60552 m.60552 type:complete len:161 (+) comp22852_c0_seq2:807-1289(+)